MSRVRCISVLLLVLVSPSSASRVIIQAHKANQKESDATTTELSSEQMAEVHRGTELLESLKEDLDNKQLQEEYRIHIGEIEWASEEEKTNFENEEISEESEVQPLGSEAKEGDAYQLVELLKNRAGRFFTNRRDYVVEKEEKSKYIIDGTTLSLHSRMHIFSSDDDKPRYVIRRAFNYLNPVAGLYGQYVYRVIECKDAAGGLTGGCKEGKYLYTITKDRLGRGLLWGHYEWRVFKGQGGCRRYGFGLLGCSNDKQVIYSLTEGLPQASWNAKYYEGQIRFVSPNGDSAELHSGKKVDRLELSKMEIASTVQKEGSPRALNWLATLTGFAPLLSLVKDLAWRDIYSLAFKKPYPDDLLLMTLNVFQELTQDVSAKKGR